ncbi:hypothetical protein C817_02305 [Dorea sp. 5-2]|jgi:hypothetical protein|nr:hypothetical protein C817_02305 [Dorea sp. 5-2]MCI9023162.1 hypothetical protein [Dorea sp.]
MCKKELAICIGIHHIATFIGISEGIYYLFAGKRRFWTNWILFLFTAFQSWAGFKILADLRTGRQRLRESYKSLEKLKIDRKQTRGLLWGIVALSTMFKVLPARLLA